MSTSNTIHLTSRATPYPPSLMEANCYYYGLPSRPRLVARSSTNIWHQPIGVGAYLVRKEASPVGSHPLQAIWEDTVSTSIVAFLDSKGVQWTSLDPVRMGEAGDPSPPVIIWIGVLPGSLSAEDGIEIANHCRSILCDNDLDDIHIEIRESEVIQSGKLYKPVSRFNPTARALMPFSTALGLPISPQAIPSIEGTGGFFISNPHYPNKLFLVTTRHVIFPPDQSSNELYQYNNPSQPRRNVLLVGDNFLDRHIMSIQSEIKSKHVIIDILSTDEKMSKEEQERVQFHLEQAQKAIEELEVVLADISRDWKAQVNRCLGHVVLSPPLRFGVGDEGFTEDWGIIEINASKITSTNFVGNAIDLGTSISAESLTCMMYPHHSNPPSFRYPRDRLLRFTGTIPNQEMWMPSSKTMDQHGEACIMVIKNGSASNVTIGRLNTIRSVTRLHPKDHTYHISKEVIVLSRNSKSGAFSELGDSGSAVVDGKGRLAGLITAGAGVAEAFDCTYLTPTSFLLQRMLKHGFHANIFPSLDI